MKRLHTTFRLPLWLALAFIGPVHAVSFDCGHAKSKIETTICASQALSELDDQLDRAYRSLLHTSVDTETVRIMQDAWLGGALPADETRAQCEDAAKDIERCLTNAYRQRIALLYTIATEMSGQSDVRMGSRYEIRDASKHYDFAIRLVGICEPQEQNENTCSTPGLIDVMTKGDKTPLHTIAMNNIFLSFTRKSRPLVNSAEMYDYQGIINVGDFNFDGREDFAVQNGNFGWYSGPSYDVYLKSRDGTGFRYNEAMSQLIMETLGFFRIDSERKRLFTMAKDGCCYHEFVEYQVVDDRPVPLSRAVQDSIHDQRYDYSHTDQWIDGQWKRIKTARSRRDSYCEDELLEALRSLAHEGGNYISPRHCKPLPYDISLGVAAMIFADDSDKGDPPGKLGLDVLLVELDGGAVLAKYSRQDEFDITHMDRDGLRIDTAKWQLAPKQRAFGVTVDVSDKAGHPHQLLTLFHRKTDNLVPVLRQIVTYVRKGSLETRRTLEMARTSSKGFADIWVHEVTRKIPLQSDASVSSKREYLLHFDGRKYVVPAELLRRPKRSSQ